MGQKMDMFVPIDALIEEKHYPEAIVKLKALLLSAPPSRHGEIKARIASVQLLQADEDLAAQRYNDAMSILSSFWAENPQRADEAQRRIRRINEVRMDYQSKAQGLLEYMRYTKNRGNADYNLEVTKRLQELDGLDRNNPDSKTTIISLKETSLSLINQDSMRSVMSSARALIDKGEYVAATREYLKGFGLFKPEFEGAGYNDMTLEAVGKLVAQDQALPQAYEALQPSFVEATRELESALASGDLQRITAATPPALRAFDEMRALRKSAFDTGRSLAKAYEDIPKAGKSPIEYQYLAYLEIFTRGRPDSFEEDKKPADEKNKSEGMGGVLLAQTEATLDRLQAAAEAGVDGAFAAAGKRYDEGSVAEAEAGFGRATALVEPASAVLAEWGRIDEKDFIPALSDLREKIRKAPAVAERLADLGTIASASARLSGIAGEIAAVSSGYSRYAARITPSTPLEEARSTLDNYRESIRKASSALEVEDQSKEALSKRADAAAAAVGDQRPLAAQADYLSRLGKARNSAIATEYAIAAVRGGAEGDFIGRELAARSSAVAAAEAKIAGSVSPLPDRARAGYRDPSPTQAAAALAAEGPKLAALLEWTSGDLQAMGKEGPGLAADKAFAAVRARIENLDSEARALEDRRAATLAAALEKKKDAAAALADAKAGMSNAQAKLEDAKSLIARDKGKGTRGQAIKKDFSDSVALLDRSFAAIIEASNSDFERTTWDDFQNRYAELKSDIAQTKKNYTVDETFRLLGEGQAYYEQALFDLASESLESAQDIWREENDADQSQVKYWQNLVKQASDTNNKREVRQSDALYYEIGNYLSEARKLFQKGDGLMKAGRKDAAAEAFDTARQNIGFVTRAFPLNAEAGLLTLQILKSTDLDAYRRSLPRRVKEAQELLANDPSAGYSRIADLYKMEPTYPGLRSLLEKAEIAVGKRRAPPTKEQAATAATFAAQAERLLATGRRDDASRAEAALNSALANDPTNRKALALLRDVETLKGKGGLTLGLADQAILDQATRFFAARQYNQARDQLSQLLADPNKRTREVLKLDNDLKTLGYN